MKRKAKKKEKRKNTYRNYFEKYLHENPLVDDTCISCKCQVKINKIITNKQSIRRE